MKNILAMAVVLLLCTATANATNIWLSHSDTSSDIEVPLLMTLPGSSGQVHVWARPDPGETLANISLNVESTIPDVIAFTGATMANPYLGNLGPLGGNKDVFRYEFTNDSNVRPAAEHRGSGDDRRIARVFGVWRRRGWSRFRG